MRTEWTDGFLLTELTNSLCNKTDRFVCGGGETLTINRALSLSLSLSPIQPWSHLTNRASPSILPLAARKSRRLFPLEYITRRSRYDIDGICDHVLEIRSDHTALENSTSNTLKMRCGLYPLCAIDINININIDMPVIPLYHSFTARLPPPPHQAIRLVHQSHRHPCSPASPAEQ